MSGVPPFESFSHKASTSSFEAHATRKDTDGLNLNNGPALISEKGCPASSMVTNSTEPEGVSLRVVVSFTALFFPFDAPKAEV
jgi:hypothetical protein